MTPQDEAPLCTECQQHHWPFYGCFAAPPASRPPGAPRYRLGSDNSGHWYFYPVDKEAEFTAWQELDEDDERSWTEPKFATRIDGQFTFTDPRCE